VIRGDLKVIILKVVAVTLGTGFLLSKCSGAFGADLVLAIVSCLS
jgi:hypothetical protein